MQNSETQIDQALKAITKAIDDYNNIVKRVKPKKKFKDIVEFANNLNFRQDTLTTKLSLYGYQERILRTLVDDNTSVVKLKIPRQMGTTLMYCIYILWIIYNSDDWQNIAMFLLREEIARCSRDVFYSLVLQNNDLFKVICNSKNVLHINNAKISFSTLTEPEICGQAYNHVIIDHIDLFDRSKLQTMREILYPVISSKNKNKLWYSTSPENNESFWYNSTIVSVKWWEMPRYSNGKIDPIGWKNTMIRSIGDVSYFKEAYGND
jgi:hypothetical protein